MGTQQNIGNHGEQLAQTFLEAKGYRTLAKNFRYGKGEIDLVMRDPEGELVFVEVKARTNATYGYPEKFVSKGQVRQIQRVAEAYCNRFGWENFMRFDIVSVLLTHPAEVEHFKDAF